MKKVGGRLSDRARSRSSVLVFFANSLAYPGAMIYNAI